MKERQINFRHAGWASLGREVLSRVVASLDRTQGFFHKVALWENWDEEKDCERNTADEEEVVDSGTDAVCWLDTELALPYGFTEDCNLEQTLSNFDEIFLSVPMPELIPQSLLAFVRGERPLPPEFGPTILGGTMERLRRILLNCPGVADEMIFSERVRTQMLENLQHAHLLQAAKFESLRTIESQIHHWVGQGVLADGHSLDGIPNRNLLSAEDIMSSAGWAKTKESRERSKRIGDLLAEVGDLLKDRDGSTHKLMMLVVLTYGLRSTVDGRSLQGGGTEGARGFLLQNVG